jgi:hypothetical protein
MSAINLSPLQLYLRYYAAELETDNPHEHEVSQVSRQVAALKRLPRKNLEALVAFAETTLSDSDENSIREMFRDGHFYFKWHGPDSARRYLENILSEAKRLSVT